MSSTPLPVLLLVWLKTCRLAATNVSGSATYRGAAAGKYAIQSTTDDSASGGHFTAAATLTANFDASTRRMTGPPPTTEWCEHWRHDHRLHDRRDKSAQLEGDA